MKSYKTSQLKIFNNNGKEYIYVYFKENNVALRINTRYEYVKNKMTADNLYNSKMKDHKKINTEILEIQYAVDTYINLIGGHKPINQKECLQYVKEYKYHKNALHAERDIKKLTRGQKEELVRKYGKNK